ncbi:MAG: trimethylamine methyltransferase family protein [Pseudomonadales bacterium]
MSRRAGGRRSRVALRNAPLAEDQKPVQPGETGGWYKPLKDEDIPKIIETTYKILSEVGFCQPTPHCIEVCTEFGATMGDDGRMRMSREVVDKAMDLCQRDLVLHGQDPKYDLDLSGQRVHFSTAGAAVMIADSETNSYRDSTAKDLYDMARIVSNCEHIHMFQRTCVARDILDNAAMDLNSAYCSVMGTQKHIGSSWTEAHHIEETLKMLHVFAGGEEAWRARPFMSQSNCFVVPPMKFAEESLECLRVAVEGGMPVLLLSAAQAGATAPACLAGAIAQAWAECLGGLVYVQAIEAGAPCILGTWPFVSDLRTGAMSGGSPEQGVLSAGCAQVGAYFNLPTGTACGMSDSKMPDHQGGSERAYTAAAAALSGANIVYESAGMYASLLGVCPESLLLDNDILGACMRMVKGIEVNTDTLSFENLKDVCLNNKAHYLGSDQTLSVMQTEYIYPEFSNRMSPNDWSDAGKPEPLKLAVQRKNELLASYFPTHVSDEVDLAIRAQFPIHLSRDNIGRS